MWSHVTYVATGTGEEPFIGFLTTNSYRGDLSLSSVGYSLLHRDTLCPLLIVCGKCQRFSWTKASHLLEEEVRFEGPHQVSQFFPLPSSEGSDFHFDVSCPSSVSPGDWLQNTRSLSFISATGLNYRLPQFL